MIYITGMNIHLWYEAAENYLDASDAKFKGISFDQSVSGFLINDLDDEDISDDFFEGLNAHRLSQLSSDVKDLKIQYIIVPPEEFELRSVQDKLSALETWYELASNILSDYISNPNQITLFLSLEQEDVLKSLDCTLSKSNNVDFRQILSTVNEHSMSTTKVARYISILSKLEALSSQSQYQQTFESLFAVSEYEGDLNKITSYEHRLSKVIRNLENASVQELSSHSIESTENKETISSLTEQLTALHEENESFRQKQTIEAIELAFDELTSKQLISELQIETSKSRNLQTELTKLQTDSQKISSLTSQLEQLKEEYQSDVESKNSEIESMEEGLRINSEKHEKEIEEALNVIKNLESKLNETHSQLLEKSKYSVSLEKKLEEIKNNEMRLHSNITQVESKLTKSNEQLELCYLQINQLQRELELQFSSNKLKNIYNLSRISPAEVEQANVHSSASLLKNI